MLSTTDDLRISELKELSTPQEVMREIPRTLTATRVVMAARNAIHAILGGTDDRLLVVVGPCSVHDPVAAVIITGLPGSALWAVGLLVGINLLFGGASMIGMALAARKG